MSEEIQFLEKVQRLRLGFLQMNLLRYSSKGVLIFIATVGAAAIAQTNAKQPEPQGSRTKPGIAPAEQGKPTKPGPSTSGQLQPNPPDAKAETDPLKPKVTEKTTKRTSENSVREDAGETETKTLSQRIESGWTLLLGLNAGTIAESDPVAPAGHEPHSGSAFGGSLILGRYDKKLAYDFGLGWSYSRIKGKETDQPSGQLIDVIVATQAGILFGSARYRVADSFEAGMTLSQWFSPDLSFSSYESKPKTSTFAGIDLVYVSVAREQIFRARVSATYDLAVPDRRISIFSLGLDFGLPLLRNDKLVKKSTVVKTKTIVRETEKTVTTSIAVPVQIVLSIIDNRMVKFSASSPNIDLKSEPYLLRLGGALASIGKSFKSVEVRIKLSEGTPSNQALAQQRAVQVGQRLVRGGLPINAVLVKGSVDKSIAATAKQPGMRIELQFTDATDRSLIENTIDGVNRQFAMPDTCVGGECQ
jgi:flagellar motor protein MotB